MDIVANRINKEFCENKGFDGIEYDNYEAICFKYENGFKKIYPIYKLKEKLK